MRTLVKILIVAYSLHVAKGADELVTNNAAIIVDTNVACTLSIDPIHGWDVGSPPVCIVRLTNSSNSIVQGLRLSAEKLFAIDLFDAQGRPVEKTEYGKQFGKPLFQEECRSKGKYISGAWFFVPFDPNGQHWQDIRWFSIPKAFKLTQAGEYTLRLRMRLIQICASDSFGTIRTNIFDHQYLGHKSKSLYFQYIWLPEVVAKIQIRSEDVPSENLLPDIQTNSPSK